MLADVNSPTGIQSAHDYRYFSEFAAMYLISPCDITHLYIINNSVPSAYNIGLKNGTWEEPPGRVQDIEHLFNAIAPPAVCRQP